MIFNNNDVMKSNSRFFRAFSAGLLFILLVSFSATAQKVSKEKLKEKIAEAKDSGANYVIMASGEKKNIKSAKLPNNYGKPGNIVLADGTSMKFHKSDIQCIQTEDGFYKMLDYNHPLFGTGKVSGLALRRGKGIYNVYQLPVHYNKGMNQWVSETLYIIEKADGTGLMTFDNDRKHVDYVETLVSKSKAAMESIAAIRKDYGKLQVGWSLESRLAETIELYNKDAAAGKLEN